MVRYSLQYTCYCNIQHLVLFSLVAIFLRALDFIIKMSPIVWEINESDTVSILICYALNIILFFNIVVGYRIMLWITENYCIYPFVWHDIIPLDNSTFIRVLLKWMLFFLNSLSSWKLNDILRSWGKYIWKS